ncbi:MMPL family transporter [Quadrisphaera setariae]|uniref:MMPL family transporter n=1 Tax=Quadrisphaera setariae TaxID=2593304 RepID=A0A5C8ZD88_9ACTN|nr:MMPL family transporter [Quadrisphaera setariae]TXR56055.1 MMPL family transporter [Quadrisphaera setariae]
MATFLQRLGRACHSRRWLVLAVWLVVLAAVGGSAAAFSKPFTADVTIPGLESTKALSTLQERFGAAAAGGDGATARVVVQVPQGQTVTDPADAQRIGQLVAELGELPQVEGVSNPFDQASPTVSPDLRAAYVDVRYGVPTGDITEASRTALVDAVEGAATGGWDAAVGGQAVTDPAALGGVGEVLGVVVAVVVLLVTYGTLVTAGLNLLTALIGVGVGALGIVAATALTDVQSTTTILAIMLGLAVGIDYGLFVLSRLRQELLAGRSVPDAVGVATGTAGSAVVTAGLTVVIALAGLSVVGIPFLTQMGVAAAATVAVAVLVALTLLPALAGVLGLRLLSRRQRHHLQRMRETTGRLDVEPHAQHAHAARRAGVLPAWARFVTRQRLVSLLAVVVVLGVVAVPVFSLRTTLGDDSTAEEGSQQRRAYDLVAQHWGPGVAGPLLVLVDGGADPTQQAAQLAAEVEGLPDVATDLPGGGVVGPVPSPDGTAALVTVIPASGPSTEATTDLVSDIRALRTSGGGQVSVTGSTAVSVDISAKLNGALPVYLAVVVGLALVLLLVVFRSVLVPVTAVLGFLLTVGAALGATVAIFEWGWLQQLVNANGEAPIISFAPILVVGILFGLAMDYQIFIVSRIHEAHSRASRSEEPMVAVVSGFGAAAPVVVAAATIMLSVFGGFVPEGNATIKPIAFALAVGVLFDAVLVRMVLIPAVLALLGRAAWWLPRWLRWLPELDVEGRAVEASLASGARGERPGEATGERTGAAAH